MSPRWTRRRPSATLEAAYAAYGEGQVVVHTSARDVVVPYSAFGRRADVAAMVDAAMQVGRSGSMVEQAIAEVRLAMDGQSAATQVTLDGDALADRGPARGPRSSTGAPVDSEIVKGVDIDLRDAEPVRPDVRRDGGRGDGARRRERSPMRRPR